jgi:hypothetical protein
VRTKPDARDALGLARFGREKQPAPVPVTDAATRELTALVRLRSRLLPVPAARARGRAPDADRAPRGVTVPRDDPRHRADHRRVRARRGGRRDALLVPLATSAPVARAGRALATTRTVGTKCNRRIHRANHATTPAWTILRPPTVEAAESIVPVEARRPALGDTSPPGSLPFRSSWYTVGLSGAAPVKHGASSLGVE